MDAKSNFTAKSTPWDGYFIVPCAIMQPRPKRLDQYCLDTVVRQHLSKSGLVMGSQCTELEKIRNMPVSSGELFHDKNMKGINWRTGVVVASSSSTAVLVKSTA